MRFSVVATAAFAGAAIAAPAAQPVAQNEKRLAGFMAFGLGSLATWAAGKFGLIPRDLTLAEGDVPYEKVHDDDDDDAAFPSVATGNNNNNNNNMLTKHHHRPPSSSLKMP